MSLSSHLRLEVLHESMEDSNLRRDILFILLPAVFQATRSTSDSTGSKVARSVPRWSHTRVDHAARRISAKLSLSLAFMFCGTLPSNQSRTALLHENRYPGHPRRWWRCGESNPGLSAFIVDCQQLIFYLYPNGL